MGDLKAVIFDVDGTLLDSVDYHAEAWRRAFAHFGYEVSFDDIRPQIGKGGDQILPVFLRKDVVEKHGKAIDQYRHHLFVREFLPKVRAFPKVRELFERILADRLKIALASSAKGDELEEYKNRAHVEDLLDAEHSKPPPRHLLGGLPPRGGAS